MNTMDNATVGSALIVQVSSMLDAKGLADDSLKRKVTRCIAEAYEQKGRLQALYERIHDPGMAWWIQQQVDEATAAIRPRPTPPQTAPPHPRTALSCAGNARANVSPPPTPKQPMIPANGTPDTTGFKRELSAMPLDADAVTPHARRHRVVHHASTSGLTEEFEELAWADFTATGRAPAAAPSSARPEQRAHLYLNHHKDSLLVTGDTIRVKDFFKFGMGGYGVGLVWNASLRGWLCSFQKRDCVIKALDSRKDSIRYMKQYAEPSETPPARKPMRAPRAAQSLWDTLAGECYTEDRVRAFFHKRQDSAGAEDKKLRIASVVKIQNERTLKAFASASPTSLHPRDAHHTGDAFLFHGCPELAAANIQAEGLQIKFAANGMLGQGLYGAPDPRKSASYAQASQHGKFVFICRFNLTEASYAGPQTSHRNQVFDEYCVFDDRHVVVLWMLKVM